MFEGLFQPMHMLVILVIALIFFGPGKLPELGSGLGKAIREFKKAMAETTSDIDTTAKQVETPKEITSPQAVDAKQETAAKEVMEEKNSHAL